ncbi:predicted protein [Postia placenta Mad-698-R]|nr:predicted protein [Postia placenta Mad-698-R]
MLSSRKMYFRYWLLFSPEPAGYTGKHREARRSNLNSSTAEPNNSSGLDSIQRFGRTERDASRRVAGVQSSRRAARQFPDSEVRQQSSAVHVTLVPQNEEILGARFHIAPCSEIREVRALRRGEFRNLATGLVKSPPPEDALNRVREEAGIGPRVGPPLLAISKGFSQDLRPPEGGTIGFSRKNSRTSSADQPPCSRIWRVRASCGGLVATDPRFWSGSNKDM